MQGPSRVFLFVALGGVALLLWGGLQLLIPMGLPISVRPLQSITYRETLVFRLQGRLIEASGIYRAEYRLRDIAGRGQSIIAAVYGEAIPIEFGNGRLAFALTAYPYGGADQSFSLWTDACLGRLPDQSDGWTPWIAVAAAKSGPCLVPPSSWPLVVTFSEPANPHSVKRVFPERLDEAFGVDISLERVFVERTNDAPSSRVRALLPWIEDGVPGGIAIETVEPYPRTDPIMLTTKDFLGTVG